MPIAKDWKKTWLDQSAETRAPKCLKQERRTLYASLNTEIVLFGTIIKHLFGTLVWPLDLDQDNKFNLVSWLCNIKANKSVNQGANVVERSEVL